MSPKRCMYTNKEATSKDTVIPKDRGDALHNWANRGPVNSDYKETKLNRLPSELEMDAHRTFYLLELARLEVTYLEEKLKEVQERITGVKQDQIEKSYHIKDLVEGFEEKIEIIAQNPTKNNKIWE